MILEVGVGKEVIVDKRKSAILVWGTVNKNRLRTTSNFLFMLIKPLEENRTKQNQIRNKILKQNGFVLIKKKYFICLNKACIWLFF